MTEPPPPRLGADPGSLSRPRPVAKRGARGPIGQDRRRHRLACRDSLGMPAGRGCPRPILARAAGRRRGPLPLAELVVTSTSAARGTLTVGVCGGPPNAPPRDLAGRRPRHPDRRAPGDPPTPRRRPLLVHPLRVPPRGRLPVNPLPESALRVPPPLAPRLPEPVRAGEPAVAAGGREGGRAPDDRAQAGTTAPRPPRPPSGLPACRFRRCPGVEVIQGDTVRQHVLSVLLVLLVRLAPPSAALPRSRR